MYDIVLCIRLDSGKQAVSAMHTGAGHETGAAGRTQENQPTMASATASATRMPSIAADMMPPA